MGPAAATRLVLSSVVRFPLLLAGRRLRLRRERLGHGFGLCDGNLYRVFRETVRPLPSEQRTVIEVGFRLRLIRSAAGPHFLFQRLCILTTPFWSGFEGFGTKLWMVDPATRGYAGIYQWGAAADARAYLRVLLPVLRAVSVAGSVFHELHPDAELEEFLRERGRGGRSGSSLGERRPFNRRPARASRGCDPTREWGRGGRVGRPVHKNRVGRLFEAVGS